MFEKEKSTKAGLSFPGNYSKAAVWSSWNRYVSPLELGLNKPTARSEEKVRGTGMWGLFSEY